MSEFVDEIIGGDGYRWYSLIDDNGDIVQEKVRLAKNYTPEREGSKIGAAELNKKVDLDQMFDCIFHVGMIVKFGNGVNPNDIFPGTWEPYAPGRMSINLDTSDPDFNEIGKTGGSKTASYPLGNNGYAKIDATATSPSTLKYDRKSVDTYDTHFNMVGGQGSSMSAVDSNTSRGVALGGSTDEGNNMPPYTVAREWIRVA